MTIMMMMKMMIITDPFTTNLVVKGPVVKGSVVKGATSVIMMITMMVMAIFTWISVDGVCTKAAKRVTLDRQYSRGRSWIRIIINDNDTDDHHHHHQ